MMPLKGIHKNIFLTGIISLLNDVSTEMIYPLIPIFLTGILKAGTGAVGIVEGIAESTGSIFKVISGFYSDRFRNRKAWMAAGYGLSVFSRPLMPLSHSWGQVLIARFVDRLGKGIRTAPRDAVIALSSSPERIGFSFGLHRALDTVGAVIGPALAFLFLTTFKISIVTIFWISMIPGIMAVLFIFAISEPKTEPVSKKALFLKIREIPPDLKLFLIISGIFTIGNSSDAFLLLKAKEVGYDIATITLIYMAYNIFYSLIATPLGHIADLVGLKKIVGFSFFYFALIYSGFAISSKSLIWLVFLLYGIFSSIEEGVKKAYVASLTPRGIEGGIFGLYNAIRGIALLPASILAGFLWQAYGSGTALFASALIGILSGLLFLIPKKQLQQKHS